MSDIAIVLLVAAVSLLLAGWKREQAAIVALLVPLSLWAAGIFSAYEAFAGFGSPALIFIAALGVLAAGLRQSGLVSLAVRHIPYPPLAAGLLAALIGAKAATQNVSGEGAAPKAVVVAARAGAWLLLTGSAVAILADEMRSAYSGQRFGLLGFLWVGLPLLAGALLIGRGEKTSVVTAAGKVLDWRAWIALGGMLALLALLALGAIPPVVAGLGSALIFIVSGNLSAQEAGRAVNWQLVVTVGGFLALTNAMQLTGAADLLAGWLVDTLEDFGPRAVLAALLLAAIALAQLTPAVVAALFLLPVAALSAKGLDLMAAPFLMATALGCTAGFRVGRDAGLTGWFILLILLVAIFWVPMAWPFQAIGPNFTG